MQLTTLLPLLPLLAPALSAPAPSTAKSMMSTTTTWTMQSFLRTCDTDDDLCSYSFSVYTGEGDATPCAYNVTGDPASEASYNSVACGDFSIGSTWSDQFGEDQGFQTLSVVEDGLIIYPAYTDAQLDGGETVSPDQSYTPQSLP